MTGTQQNVIATTSTSKRFEFRTLIALTMLLIATLGAGVAGWAAIKQQSSTSLERRLAQGQIMELSDRLKLVEFSRSARTLQERLERHLSDAKRHRALALQQKADDPAQAGLRELQTQEALLLANVIRPYTEQLPNIISPDMNLDERRIGLVAAGSLQRRGIQASWVEPRDGEEPRIEYGERQQIDAFDEQVLGLALVVVALVFSLVLLTFADLSGRRTFLRGTFYATAVVAATLAMAAALWIDLDLTMIVGGVMAAFVVFTLLAYLLGWLLSAPGTEGMLQPQGIDTQGFAGTGVQLGEAATGFSRFLVLSIAMAAFVSSIIGYWYSAAGVKGDDAAQQGYQQQLEIVKRSGRANTAVLSTFDALIDLSERRIHCQSARNQAELARDGKIAVTEKMASANAQLHCAGLEGAGISQQDSALLDLDRQFGPLADPRFPLRLQQHVAASAPGGAAEESLALWDGFGELTAFWSAKTTSFLACLTIAAIALYIFGQALSMVQLRVTRAMAAVGVAMTMGTFGWSMATWLRAFPAGTAEAVAQCALPERTDRDKAAWGPETWMRVAAHNYASGSQLLVAAEAENEYAVAIAALECAVGARPNLVLAHNELAGGKALIQSAHKGQSYYSLPTKDRLDEIERNARTAVVIQKELGLAPSVYALNSHAVALWGLGIRDGKLDQIGAALKLVDRAVGIVEGLEADRRRVSADPTQNLYPWISMLPLLYLNQSLFLLANDRLAEGRVVAEKALALGSHRDWTLAGTMVTATGLLQTNCERLQPADRCPAIKAAVASYRRALIDGVWNPDLGKTSPRAQDVAVAATATSSNVTLATRIAGFDAAKDRLSVIWSIADPQWQVLDALTNVSPPVDPAELRVVRDRGVTYQRGVLAGSAYRRCLSPGTYSAEVFVNGAPAATATTTLAGPATTAARLDTLNLAFCNPAGWQPWLPSKAGTAAPQDMAGFVTGQGRPAAFLFSFAMPSPAANEVVPQNDYAIERALRLLVTHGIAAGPLDALKGRLQTCDKTTKDGIARGIARASSGLVHVALVMGDAVEGINVCGLMQSVTIMQAVPE